MTKTIRKTRLYVFETTEEIHERSNDPPPRRNHPSGIRPVIDTTGEEVRPGLAKGKAGLRIVRVA